MNQSVLCACGCGLPISKRAKRFAHGHHGRVRDEPRRPPVVNEGEGIAIIPLTQGRQAIIDVADLPTVANWNWTAYRHKRAWYAMRNIGGGKFALLHRAILGFGPDDPIIDHADGDGLNNRRSNLRPCTKAQNGANSTRSRKSRAGFRGVYRSPSHRPRWFAQITLNNRMKYLGSYDSPEEAARAYDAAAVNSFGEFARTNFPQDIRRAS